MLSRSIPRFLLQAGLLIAAASIAAVVHLGAAAIVLVMAGAFGLVVVGEWLASREGAASAMTAPAAQAASPLRRLARRRTAQPPRTHAAALLPPPGGEQQPPDRRPQPAAPAPGRTPVPPPPAVPAEPEVRPAPVSPRARPATPAPPIAPPVAERRRWNVFVLQNGAREIAGADAARDGELSFLLLYLRECADVAGDLSEDFDAFVRESLPDLIGL